MNLTTRILAYLILKIFKLPLFFSNWFRVRILGKHKSFKELGSEPTENKIAIVAIYAGTSSLNSILRLIDELNTSGYQTVIVMNKNNLTDEWIKAILPKTQTILVRENIGQDFGAYQLGINYVRKKLGDTIEHLLIANDTLHFSKNNLIALRPVLESNSDFNCIWVNKQTVRHAGSMLLYFDKSVLKRKSFWNFWKFYYPYFEKRQIIRKGELRLSKVVGLDYFNPLVSLNNLKKSKKALGMSASQKSQIRAWASLTGIREAIYINNAIDHKKHLYAVSYAMNNLHISNSLGLYLAEKLDMPLKLDLISAGLISEEDFFNYLVAQKTSIEEIKEILLLMTKRKLYSEGNILERILEEK